MQQVIGKFRNKLKQKDSHVTTLQAALLGAGIVILYLMLLYWDAKEEQLFRVPPDLRQGAVMRANDVAPPTVYSFAYYILQQVNHWPKDGEEEYGKKIYYLQAFLTPKFREDLIDERDLKSQKGELRRRVRKIQEVYGRGYESDRVLIESKDSWVVWVDVEISETIHGQPVKSVYVQYPLRIVRYDVDPESNPWGLAISEYAGKPRRLTDEEVGQPFKRSF